VPTIKDRLSLKKNFCWTLAGNVTFAGCQWLSLMVLAKLGSAALVGRLVLGLAVVGPVFMLTNLQLTLVQATDAKQTCDFSDYLGLRIATTILGFIAIMAIIMVVGYDIDKKCVILAVGLAKGFECISTIYYAYYQVNERMNYIAPSMIMRGVLMVLCLAAGVYLAGSLTIGALAWAASWAAVVFLYDRRFGAAMLRAVSQESNSENGLPDSPSSSSRPTWNKAKLMPLVWLALPLGLVMMLASLTTQVPRYFVEHYLGENDLGIFAGLTYAMVAGTTVLNALGGATVPRMARHYAEGQVVAFKRLLTKLIGIAALLGVAGWVVALVAGKPLLALIYRPEFAEYQREFVWLMAVAVLVYFSFIFGFGMSSVRYFRIQVPLLATVILVLGLACLFLIPRAGLLGAIMAVGIGSLVNIFLSAAVVVYALRRA